MKAGAVVYIITSTMLVQDIIIRDLLKCRNGFISI